MKEGFSVICLLTLEGVFLSVLGVFFPKRLFLVIFKIERRGYLERREWNKLEGQPSFIREGYWLLTRLKFGQRIKNNVRTIQAGIWNHKCKVYFP